MNNSIYFAMAILASVSQIILYYTDMQQKSDGGLMGTVDKLPHIEVSESNFITSTYRLVRCRMRF